MAGKENGYMSLLSRQSNNSKLTSSESYGAMTTDSRAALGWTKTSVMSLRLYSIALNSSYSIVVMPSSPVGNIAIMR